MSSNLALLFSALLGLLVVLEGLYLWFKRQVHRRRLQREREAAAKAGEPRS